MHQFLCILALASSFAMAGTAETPCTCANGNQVVGPSFTVRGRLSYWNGAPTLRIWILGTKRMLGVRSTSIIPPEIQPGTFDTEVWGDFVVFPLTKQKKGVMQFVCIESASNIVRKIKTSKPPK